MVLYILNFISLSILLINKTLFHSSETPLGVNNADAGALCFRLHTSAVGEAKYNTLGLTTKIPSVAITTRSVTVSRVY